jgi:GT2 family glycosyltransferase/glycosyltransferase involved in cell wall biosynthesis/SAM-dependent methyltransferase
MPGVSPDAPHDLPRLAGAPRLIDWTGERCVPWAPDVQVVYEHFHRYLWAAGLVAGRRVLDIASGEGFGSALLARTAESVVGIDIDETSVRHSRLNYALANLRFEPGDARDLSAFADGSFDAVVAFEVIEHIAEQERMLDEVKRVLVPGGLLIVSTPDREPYDQASGENPFHVRELDRDEFGALLSSKFAHVGMWGQRTVTGSSLTRLDERPAGAEPAARTYFIERAGEEWRVAPGVSPLYLVGLASDGELPEAPANSSLHDGGIQLVRAAEKAAADAVGRMQEEHDHLARELERERHEFERYSARTEDELTAQRRELERLRAKTAHDAHRISSLDAALNAERKRLLRIEGSVTWQLFQRVRGRTFRALGGEDSRRVAALQASLRFLGRALKTSGLAAGRSGPVLSSGRRPATGPIELPSSEEPVASIVIPLYSHAELTRAALESIVEHTQGLQYEVILVDDAADPKTKELLRRVRGARIIVNETNAGYLRSIERGTSAARGRWLVLCNNDIEVQPGWLSALLTCGESAGDIAIVAPKFLYPDGSLAEAGGIIWRDGTGANYGRGEDPTRCHYEYRREIDYGSAAALLVRRDFWEGIGGFDKRFDPMYFEDTDLGFQARARGLRALYEPRAQVVHVEGATAGTDESSGHKRHQAVNRAKFVEKWREMLESEHLPNDQANLYRGANLRRSPHVLIIDHRMPMWDRESGALRMRGMVQALLDFGAHVSFLPDNFHPTQPYARILQEMGAEVLYGLEIPGDLARILPTFSHVVLCRPQVAGRWLELVREHAPDAHVIYDTVDLHWVREARRAAKDAGSEEELVLSPKAATMREIELALIRAADATVVVTAEEQARVEHDVPDAVVHVVPNVNEIRVAVPPARGRKGVMFVGGFEHAPNVDAALTLVGEVMPLVWRELPDVAVTIVGADPPAEVQALASAQVEIAGWVADLEPVIDSARALVAPLRYGAGLKGKVTQAMAAGLPVVTTAIGAEGLDARDGEHLLIGETAEELAERVLRVLTDDELWERLSRNGQERAAERCSPQVMSEALRRLVLDSRAAALSAAAS